MKICIAQTQPSIGNVNANIQNHKFFIQRAIKLQADLIIFPELSLTGYEPELAHDLASDAENSIFDPFQTLSDLNGITIGVGMPTNGEDGIYISSLLFQPKQKRTTYSKQMLHADELPYFLEGNKQTILTIRGQRIAFGICYETLQRQHFIDAQQSGLDIYIASVAKSQNGIDQAYLHYAQLAKEFQTPILLSNCIGNCDNFLSAGQSAVWNQNGSRICQLDNNNEGILIYDTLLGTQKKAQLIIEKAKLTDLAEILLIYKLAKTELESKGIFQWTDKYPSTSIIESDIQKEDLYILRDEVIIVGVINISENQEKEYQPIAWKYCHPKNLVIHRLVIHPAYQKQGFASKLMDFAEEYALKYSYKSIRLDTYSKNKRAIDFYSTRGYSYCGDVNFPGRASTFHCMEKQVTKQNLK